jgi:branched-chain amino acid transport system substrate-binding protein
MALGAAVSAGMLTVPASVNSAHGAETVAVALSTTLSGSIAELGRTGLRGIQMALDRINAEGGLLGKQIRLVSADDGAFPANGVSNVRHMILVDKAVAIFGPATSAVGTAVETVAGQYRLPVFFHMANDIQITTSNFTKYAFELVPNTVMEPRAIAYYFAENVAPKTGGKKLKIATITPNYSYGRDTVEVFLKTLRELRVNFEVVAQELPQLGATDYTSYISALLAAHPDYVFAAIFGGDLITFTKQAQGFNFFKQTRIVGFYDQVALRVLGADSPEGAIGWNRAHSGLRTGPALASFSPIIAPNFTTHPRRGR